jgi:hypothetical protein
MSFKSLLHLCFSSISSFFNLLDRQFNQVKIILSSYICRSDSEEAKYFYPLKSEVVVFRLVSHEWLFGQIFDEKHIKDYQTFINKYKPNFSQDKAENLIIHFHGGGFIAHSSLTSEVETVKIDVYVILTFRFISLH